MPWSKYRKAWLVRVLGGVPVRIATDVIADIALVGLEIAARHALAPLQGLGLVLQSDLGSR